MAVLTKSTDIKVGDEKRLLEIFTAKANPSKEAFDRIARAKKSQLFRGNK